LGIIAIFRKSGHNVNQEHKRILFIKFLDKFVK
jgi:hypothetical protein